VWDANGFVNGVNGGVDFLGVLKIFRDNYCSKMAVMIFKTGENLI